MIDDRPCLMLVKDVTDQVEGKKRNKTTLTVSETHFHLSVWRYHHVYLPSICFLSYRLDKRIQMRILAMLASILFGPLFLSLSLSPSAILMLNSYSVAGRCRNNHRAQHSFSMPGRKWPGQLLAIQPETCDLD